MTVKQTALTLALFLLLPLSAPAQESGAEQPDDAQAQAPTTSPAPDPEESDKASAAPAADPGQPRTMSGMSILGNEEAPKALVIVPWKSSELAGDLTLSDTLDDRARAVDREVFLRELDYFRLRSGD